MIKTRPSVFLRAASAVFQRKTNARARSLLSTLLSMSLFAQSAYSAPTQTPAEGDTPRVEYYTPCADLLTVVKEKRFEEHLVANINEPGQLVQLLKDYGIFSVHTIRYVIDQKLDELDIVPANEFDVKYVGPYAGYQPGVDAALRKTYYENSSNYDRRSRRRALNNDKNQALGKLIDFVKRPSEELAPIAWDTFESIKTVAASDPDAAEAQVTHAQFLKLVAALKSNPASKKLVENLFIDLMRREALNIASTMKGDNLFARRNYNGFAMYVANMSFFATAVAGLSQIWPDSGGALPAIAFLAGTAFAIFSATPDGQAASLSFYNKLLNPNDVAKRYAKAQNAPPTESAETQKIANELLVGIKIGPLPHPEPLEVAATIDQLCDINNICDLKYSQIAYAGDVDLVRLDTLNHQLLALIETHKTLTGAKALIDSTNAAARPNSSVEQLLKFRQSLAIAARDSETESNKILGVVYKIEAAISNLKSKLQTLQKRSFRFGIHDTSEEALQKKALVAAVLQTNSEIVDRIELDSSQLEAQIERSRALTKSLRLINAAQPQNAESVRAQAQAEEVLLLLEQYNLEGH